MSVAAILLSLLTFINPPSAERGLFEAIIDGDLPTVRFLLTLNPQLLNADLDLGKRRLMPLQVAAERNQIAVLKLLIDIGADVNAPLDRWGSPLQRAADRGHRKIAEVLLAKGARLDMYSAVALGRCDDVERLLRLAAMIGLEKRLANVRWDESPWRSTPLLCLAKSKGQAEMARLLLRYGADPNAKVIKQPYFVSDVNLKGEVRGLIPAGTWAPDLDVPIRRP